ncbi:uncharacterized protein LOC135847730 isoform X4 [Planococcus citri]|uniref:uncharacterized protein LOC135847730 isoform X4 n=1 Tax=Planococcus citri TaxID=170843 RepID=UPI0031F7A97B
MAEKPSNLYDIFHPTPVSLKELSVIVVGRELWRCEIDRYRKDQALEKFRDILLFNKTIKSLKTKLPELPSVIYDVIVECVTRLGNSISDWLEQLIKTLSRVDCVLKYFDDFVCDYNGTVDFVKTAERMMHCDRFDDVLKFHIACRYFLEDHVRRLWPSVKEKLNVKNINFHSKPLMFYWICYLSNQLNMIPLGRHGTVDEAVFEICIRESPNPLAINYFWNRVPYEKRMQMADYAVLVDIESFVRSFLLKLDDQQLEKLVNEKGSNFMQAVLNGPFSHERFIFQTWIYVKNIMNGSTFSRFLVNILITNHKVGLHDRSEDEKFENRLHQCCLIWNDAPHDLKRSAITKISSDLEITICREAVIRAISTEFLLSIISHFTSETKQCFWSNCWQNLMLNKNARDLQRIMEICFEHEDDIVKFKENVMAESGSLQRRCISLFSRANFDELDALAYFHHPRSAEAAKHLKQRILQSSFIAESSGFHYTLVDHCEEFDTFIDKAYDSVDLANDFKHQLVSSPNNLVAMLNCVDNPEFSFEALRKFIETFVSTEQILQPIKSFIIDRLKDDAVARDYVTMRAAFRPSHFDQFLLWCLGSNEQVVEFWQTYIIPNKNYRYFSRCNTSTDY